MRAHTLLAALLALALPVAAAAASDSFPDRPIRFVVPYAAGALNDFMARTLADAVAPILGQTVIVENRSGASGQIGTDYVAKAPADGYTILMGSNEPLGLLPAVKADTPYSVPDDFTFIGKVSAPIPWVLAVSRDFPAKTIQEFVDYAHRHPGKVRYGSNGIGSGGHLAFAQLALLTDSSLTHIPYKGTAPIVNDLLGGHLDAAMTAPGTLLPYADTDRMRVLAVTGSKRHAFFPDAPATAEVGLAGVDAEIWFGIVAPAGVPENARRRLSAAFESALQNENVRSMLIGKGVQPEFLDGNAFTDFAKAYLEQSRRVVKAAAITSAE
mgnify:CR=1 FL=1